MNLTPPTAGKLRQELHRNLIDLFADVLLLDCLLFAPRDGAALDQCCPLPVPLQAAQMLGDHIAQHAGDTANLSRWLLLQWSETSSDNRPT